MRKDRIKTETRSAHRTNRSKKRLAKTFSDNKERTKKVSFSMMTNLGAWAQGLPLAVAVHSDEQEQLSTKLLGE